MSAWGTSVSKKLTFEGQQMKHAPAKGILRWVESRILEFIGNDRFLPLQIDITNLCNLRCVHCYHPNHKNADALSLCDWYRVLTQYEELVDRLRFDPYLIICGGEPLISPLLEPLLERIRESHHSYRVSILTNGTLVGKFDFAKLAGLAHVSFQVSLDGPDAASHDSVRGAGAFEKSIKGIAALKAHGYRVDLGAVLSKRSAPMISAFFDLAKSLKVASMGFTRLIALGEAEKLVSSSEDRPLSPLELKCAFERIVLESARTRVLSNQHKPLFRLLHPKLGRSGRYGEGLVVDHRGNILASSRSRLIIGHVFNEGLEKILLTHPILKAIRDGSVEVCGDCAFYLQCGGDRNSAYAHSGNYLGSDPGCWLHAEAQNKIRNQQGD